MNTSTGRLTSLVAPFEEAVNNRYTRLSRHSAKQKILGWFCTYTPIEMIHAAGFLPVRIRGGQTSIERANALTPNFICPYMRAALERALRGEYDYLSGIIQGYTCDVPCGMINIWEENIGHGLYHTLPLPYNTGPEARQYFREALNELTAKLTEAGGRMDDASLAKSLDLYRDIRNSLLKLHELRRQDRLPLSARQFYTITEAGFSLPPVDFLARLSILLAELSKQESVPNAGLPVLVSGSLIEDMRVYDMLEAARLRITADDLCSGYRFCEPPDGQGRDPVDRLIDRYMHRFPCPARSYVDERVARVKALTVNAGVKGVLFILQKFCTPHLADYPALATELKKAGIPALLVELEESGGAGGQLKTRFEAFREMIGG